MWVGRVRATLPRPAGRRAASGSRRAASETATVGSCRMTAPIRVGRQLGWLASAPGRRGNVNGRPPRSAGCARAAVAGAGRRSPRSRAPVDPADGRGCVARTGGSAARGPARRLSRVLDAEDHREPSSRSPPLNAGGLHTLPKLRRRQRRANQAQALHRGARHRCGSGCWSLARRPRPASGEGEKRTLRIVATYSQTEFLDLGTTGAYARRSIRVLGDTDPPRAARSAKAAESAPSPMSRRPTTRSRSTASPPSACEADRSPCKGVVEETGEFDPRPFRVAITGGTGAYRGASGEAIIRNVSETRSIYRLRLNSTNKKQRQRSN